MRCDRFSSARHEVAGGVGGDEPVPLVERDRGRVRGLDVQERRGRPERGAPVEDLGEHGGGQAPAPLGRASPSKSVLGASWEVPASIAGLVGDRPRAPTP